MIEHDRSGLLVPNGDGAALGEAIVALCNDPARRAALGQAARDRMADFGHDQVLARWQSVITSILDHHRRSEEHTSELQSLMRISYAVFCLKNKHDRYIIIQNYQQ